MSITLRRDPKTVFPDILDWFEEPFPGLRPYWAPTIKVEDYAENGQYVVRAEIPGIDPDKDLDVSVGAGYLTIRAERSSKAEGRRRSEFRYGSLSRTLEFPPGADASDVTAEYADGVLTVKAALKGEPPEARKRIQVTSEKK